MMTGYWNYALFAIRKVWVLLICLIKFPKAAPLLSKAGGNFILPQNLESTQLIMVCTALKHCSLRSMIQEVTLKQIPFLRMHLIFGARKVEDILYQEEMEKLAEILPNFSYDICLSKEPSWPGYRDMFTRFTWKNTRPSTNKICFICADGPK